MAVYFLKYVLILFLMTFVNCRNSFQNENNNHPIDTVVLKYVSQPAQKNSNPQAHNGVSDHGNQLTYGPQPNYIPQENYNQAIDTVMSKYANKPAYELPPNYIPQENFNQPKYSDASEYEVRSAYGQTDHNSQDDNLKNDNSAYDQAQEINVHNIQYRNPNSNNAKSDRFNYENHPGHVNEKIPTTVTNWEMIIGKLYTTVVSKDKNSPVKNLVSGEWIKDAVNGTFNLIGDAAEKVQNIIPFGDSIKKTIHDAYLNVKDTNLKRVEAMTSTIGEVFDKISDDIKIVMPGTHFCGLKNKENLSEEEGLFYLTDGCCKKHDICNDTLKSGEVKNGLYNNGFLKRSHCDCDQEFYNCLKNTRSPIAEKIGSTYFNTLNLQCFAFKYPAVCKRNGFITDSKCLEYNYKMNEPPKFQWFDQQDF